VAYQWTGTFAAFAGCFVLAGACGLSLNALVPVTRETLDPEAEDYREA